MTQACVGTFLALRAVHKVKNKAFLRFFTKKTTLVII